MLNCNWYYLWLVFIEPTHSHIPDLDVYTSRTWWVVLRDFIIELKLLQKDLHLANVDNKALLTGPSASDIYIFCENQDKKWQNPMDLNRGQQPFLKFN